MTSQFADLGVPTDLVRALEAAGISTPFPIQAKTVVESAAGRDLCGRAPTGSGKTLAFCLPIVMRTKRAKPHAPTALILTPTRELAAQIRETLLPLARTRSLTVATIYGGTSIGKDIQRLRKGVDIVVATPGRLADLVQRGEVRLGSVRTVVLDEADRMADMGFLPEVKRLLDLAPADRQTLLFSATLDGDVDVLVKRYQVNPVIVEIDDAVHEAGDVRHLFWPTDRLLRRDMTAKILDGVVPAIVFTRTKRGADRLAKQLRTDGIKAEAIHGDRSQRQRERALANFAKGTSTTLVATDVAARGIHIDDVAVVVHYDAPGTDKDYVHRSGRTGRAGATGLVVSLVTDEDHAAVDTFQKLLELPRGLHEVDFDHLTSDDVPEPSTQTRTSRPGGGSRNGSKNKGRGARPAGRNTRGRSNGGGNSRKPQGAKSVGGQRSNAEGTSNGSRNTSGQGSGKGKSSGNGNAGKGSSSRNGSSKSSNSRGNGGGPRGNAKGSQSRGAGGSRQRSGSGNASGRR